MNATKLFPTILIVLDLCASAVYAFDCDWRRVVYWLAAAVLIVKARELVKLENR